MKRFLIVLVLMVCLAAVAFATIQSAKNKAVNKTEKKEMKKKRSCSHSCDYYSCTGS